MATVKYINPPKTRVMKVLVPLANNDTLIEGYIPFVNAKTVVMLATSKNTPSGNNVRGKRRLNNLGKIARTREAGYR
jgi:hypothetical protein